jgi:hypothetical protein
VLFGPSLIPYQKNRTATYIRLDKIFTTKVSLAMTYSSEVRKSYIKRVAYAF